MKKRITNRLLFFCVFLILPTTCRADDWPMWRHDAARSAVTEEQLPSRLYPQWTRKFPEPRIAWPDKSNAEALRFDAVYQPVVLGKLIFVAAMNTDSVKAYETDTGREKWRFYTGGPVRFAPAGHENRLYVASDDGYLYCLDAEKGALLWKFNGGPTINKVIGHGRLTGMWPLRGGPAYCDGEVYVTAGIWPFAGIFVHALDAKTGRVLWTNSGTGSNWSDQPHMGSKSFAGVAPQGYVAVTADKVLVPGGRNVPAGFDREAGTFLYFRFAADGKDGGRGSFATSANDHVYLNGNHLYLTENGADISGPGNGIITSTRIYSCDGSGINIWDAKPVVTESKDRKGRITKVKSLKQTGRVSIDTTPSKLFLKAGEVIYGSKQKTILAIHLTGDTKARIAWKYDLAENPASMLAADGKLFVVTEDHSLYCFGSKEKKPQCYDVKQKKRPAVSSKWIPNASTVAETVRGNGGYCVALGIGSGGLIRSIIAETGLFVIAVDPDEKKVNALRGEMDDLGIYGERISAHIGNPFEMGLPPYLARAVVTENLSDSGYDAKRHGMKSIFRILRPYGGSAFLSVKEKVLKAAVKDEKLENAKVSSVDGGAVLTRAGALAGAASWTHNNADAANTLMSKDKRIKPPFGLLWYGGASNDSILPRHGHGPTPQVAGGRLLIEGADIIRAVDVYTGRVLWEKEIPGIGTYYNETRHFPGANEIGGNYVSLEDAVYVMTTKSCLVLDPDTGKTLKEFELPVGKNGERPTWAWICVWKDTLFAAVLPVDAKPEGRSGKEAKPDSDKEGIHKWVGEFPGILGKAEYSAGSAMLAAMDRHTGRVKWTRRAQFNFRHNGIVVGAGRVFCIDAMTSARLNMLKRRGYMPVNKPRLYALDAGSGKVIWETSENVFGTWLGYSAEHDALLQAGSRNRDRAADDVGKGIVVYQGKTGEVIWKDLTRKYYGPLILYRDKIITNGDPDTSRTTASAGSLMELLTGKKANRVHPLTGEPLPWTWSRYYGCNTAIASEHLLTFRSGAAGFYDMVRRSGTGNMGGFKSGCTSSLIPADGVLSAPDFTRTCTCPYQNQSSLALIHMPEAEMWVYSQVKWDGKPVKRVGINIGAPGDRQSNDGTYWLDYPSVGGPSPDIPITVTGDKIDYFRQQSQYMAGGVLKWVAASGVENIEKMTIKMSNEKLEKFYTVRLFFQDPDVTAEKGDRVFSVNLRDKAVVTELDIVKEAKGPRTVIVKELKKVKIDDTLTLEFHAKIGKTLLCGVELVRE